MKQRDGVSQAASRQMSRREGLKLGAAGLAASLLPVTAVTAAQTESPAKRESVMADNTAIRPFHFEASKADLTDLRDQANFRDNAG